MMINVMEKIKWGGWIANFGEQGVEMVVILNKVIKEGYIKVIFELSSEGVEGISDVDIWKKSILSINVSVIRIEYVWCV